MRRRHMAGPQNRSNNSMSGSFRRLRQLPRWKKVTGALVAFAALGLFAGGGEKSSRLETTGNPAEVQAFVASGTPPATGALPSAIPTVGAIPTAAIPTATLPAATPPAPLPTAVLTALDPATPAPATAVAATALAATPVPTTAVAGVQPPAAAQPTGAPATAVPAPTPTATVVPQPASNCHPSYTPCVPNVPYDLNCDDIDFSVQVIGPDQYGFDRDRDGSGCEGNR